MANEAKQFTIGGVTHDVMDVGARQLIAGLQAAIDAITRGDTTTAIKTFQEVIDFLDGVTVDVTLVGKLNELRTLINAKVDKVTGKGLSTNDYTTAEKQKLAGLSNYDDSALQTAVGDLKTAIANVYTKAQTYTKTEVDEAIADAVEGLGGGSVESVTINGVNHEPINGVVDLGTIQGAKGDKGEKGDTVVINPEGLAQFEIANDLDTSDPTQGLSARQGKILKQAISTVQANLQAVVDALANMAFTSAKPTLSQIDWTGGTFYATISKNLTGVNDSNDATQVAEGSEYNNTLTPQSGLAMKSVVVMMGRDDVTADVYTPSTGTIHIASVTGNIVITALAEEVVTRTVTKKLLNMTSSNTTGDTTDPDFGYKLQSVEDGSSYSTTLAAVSGATSNNDVVVKMGGVDITSTAYNSSTGVVSIAEVTGDVTIIATAATGVIKVTSNAAVTGGITLSGTTLSGTTITNKAIDLVNGELTLEDAMQTITKFTLSSDAKAAITSVDFGGAILKENCFGGTSSSTACTNLTSVLGAVLHQPKDGADRYSLYYAFANCSSLAVLQTIGWTKQVDFMRNTFKGTALTSLDVEDLNVKDKTLDSVFSGMANLSALRLPNLRNVEVFKSTFSNIGLESIKLDGGNITSLQSAFGNTRKLTFIDLSDTTITSSLTDVQQIFAAPSANKTLKIGSFDLSGVTSNWNSNMSCVKTLICTTVTPPNSAMFGENLLTGLTAIYVPDAVVNDYRTAWSDKASIIHSINDYNA